MSESQPPRPRAAALPERLQQLLDVVDRLRSDQGCPWDREQTPDSLVPYLLEETYEVIESIEDGNWQALKEELGDLLLHVVFQTQMARDAGHFTVDDCLQSIVDKLIRRHPHVFGDAAVEAPGEVPPRWETAKRREKGRASLLDGIPRQLPALTRARRVQEKAAAVGFDWPTPEAVRAKVDEELQELREACASDNPDAIEDEFGDVLFSLVNLGRALGLDAEAALRRAIGKFEWRFREIERQLERRGQSLETASLAEMDAIWNRLRQQATPPPGPEAPESL